MIFISLTNIPNLKNEFETHKPMYVKFGSWEFEFRNVNVGNECKFVEFEGVLVLRPKSNLRHDRIGFTCWKRRTHGTKQGYRLTDLFLNHTCRSGVVDRTSVNSKHSGAKSTEMDINSTKFADPKNERKKLVRGILDGQTRISPESRQDSDRIDRTFHRIDRTLIEL